MDDRGNIYLGHLQLAAQRDFFEFAVRAEAGIVNEKLDGDALALRVSKNGFGRAGLGQVRGKGGDDHAVARAKISGKLLEAVFAAGGEDEVGATRGKLLGN